MKAKNHMITSINADKLFKIKLAFIIKKKNSLENHHRKNLPQHNKSHIQQTQSNHYPQQQKLEALPLRLETRQGCPLSPVLLNIVLEGLAMTKRGGGGEIKGIQIGKEEVKLFADDMILYRKP